MSARVRAVVIILSTLVIGVVAGASITGALFRQRLEYVRSFGQTEGFVQRFTELIGPMSDEQRSKIEPLLAAAGTEIKELAKQSGSEFSEIMRRLDQDLSAHLTPEQMQLLRARRAEARNRYLGRYTIVADDAPPGSE